MLFSSYLILSVITFVLTINEAFFFTRNKTNIFVEIFAVKIPGFLLELNKIIIIHLSNIKQWIHVSIRMRKETLSFCRKTQRWKLVEQKCCRIYIPAPFKIKGDGTLLLQIFFKAVFID